VRGRSLIELPGVGRTKSLPPATGRSLAAGARYDGAPAGVAPDDSGHAAGAHGALSSRRIFVVFGFGGTRRVDRWATSRRRVGGPVDSCVRTFAPWTYASTICLHQLRLRF